MERTKVMEIKKEVRKKWARAGLCGAARCSPVGAINTGYKLWFSSPPRHLTPIKPTIYDSHTNPKQPHCSNFFGRQIYRLARRACTELCNIERRKTRCTDSWLPTIFHLVRLYVQGEADTISHSVQHMALWWGWGGGCLKIFEIKR